MVGRHVIPSSSATPGAMSTSHCGEIVLVVSMVIVQDQVIKLSHLIVRVIVFTIVQH